MTAEVAREGGRGAVALPFAYPRRRRRIKGSSIATLVFLSMCAAFIAIPLYVIIVTSFKTMQQITLGEIESKGNRRNSLSCRKAAAFQGWHEPDESRDSRPAL